MDKCTLVFPISGKSVWLARKKAKVGHGLYNGWGGKLELEDNGDLKQAAVREFFQESGVKVKTEDLELMAIIEFYEDQVLKFECYVYFVEKWEGELVETDEMGAGEIFPLRNPPYREMMEGDYHWFPLIVIGVRSKAKCYYSAGNKQVLEFICEVSNGPLET